MSATKIFIKIAINTGIGIIFILIWLRFVNLGEILNTISSVSLLALTPVFIALFISPTVRALRLKIFLAPIKKLSWINLVFLNGVSTMLNYLIPLRGGEIAKGVYLNQAHQIPLGKSLIWIFLDRFIDFLAVLILATGLFFVVPTTLNIKFILGLIAIFFIGLILTYFMVYQMSFAKKIFHFLSYLLILNNIKIYFHRISIFFLDCFTILKREPLDLLILFILTVLAYAADAAIWYYTFLAIGSHQGYFKMYLGQLLSALTYLIPAAPGYVGSAEASGLLIFSGIFGINPNLASSMVVLFHICTTLFIISFGAVSVYFLKIDLGLIFKKVLNRS